MRLTVRKNGIVYYQKDGHLIAPVNMSSFDCQTVMTRLAELEDKAEPEEPEITTIRNVDYPTCPKCGRVLWKSEQYCPLCGQNINREKV